jgi:hypothetical protein
VAPAVRNRDQWRSLVEAVARTSTAAPEIERLRGAALDEPGAFVEAFRDDLGHRRAIYRPVVAWSLGCNAEPGGGTLGPDTSAWYALAGRGPGAFEVPPGDGPLCEDLASEGIEAWTEAELSLLHALWWRAAESVDARNRAVLAARWLVAELQPDNATNRPWAVAVFAQLATDGERDASLYAETLIHNCQTQFGRPDRFSTFLLLDAARRLGVA